MTEDDTDPLEEINRPEKGAELLVKEANERVVKALEARRNAYTRWMHGKPIGDDMAIVKADLRQFCRADVSAYNDSERVHVLLTGRQEVWLRIKDFSTLSIDAILEKYTQAYEAKAK